MKREEALRIIKECKEKGFKHTFYTLNEYHTALDIAIKALEQEPCEDCISRQAVLNLINADWKYEGLEEDVSSLPPVTPQPKTGHWRAVYQGDEIINYRCSECELGDTNGSINLYGWDYCRRCGAKMNESQESEDKG